MYFDKNYAPLLAAGLVQSILICFIPSISAQGYEYIESVNPLWLNKTVPYIISTEFPENAQRIINGALLELSEKTCLRYKPMWSSEIMFLHFLPDPSYTSQCQRNAMIPGGKIIVNLPVFVPATCFTHRNVLKIVLNSLGFTSQDYSRYTDGTEATDGKGCGKSGGGRTRKQIIFEPAAAEPESSGISPLKRFCCENA